MMIKGGTRFFRWNKMFETKNWYIELYFPIRLEKRMNKKEILEYIANVFGEPDPQAEQEGK